MNDHDKAPTQFPLACLGCGKPMTKGEGFCCRCLDQGHGWIVPSCEGCEGRALEDVEEEQQG